MKNLTKAEIESAFLQISTEIDKKEFLDLLLDNLGYERDDDSSKILDDICTSFFEDIEKEYNKWSVKEKTLHTDLIRYPKIVKDVKNVHKYPNSLHAFSLKDIKAGQVIYETIKLQDTDSILGRVLIGYSLASQIRATKNPKLLLPTIKALINELEETLGFSHNKLNYGTYLTFKRPGYNTPVYFREQSDLAAYEIRIFSDAILAE